MYSINKLPDDSMIPPIDTLLKGRPDAWQGLPIDWSCASDPVPVYLARFRTSKDLAVPNVFLFGARYNLVEALLEGESLGAGNFVEYFVVCGRPEASWSLHRLLQRQSVTFSEVDEAKDYVPADTVTNLSNLVVHRLPCWESESDAAWPTNHGKPMIFLGQIALPETKLTRALFTWGISVYLFWSPNGRDSFKVITQASGVQTADEHYESEA
jgi:hypothetical protein